MRYLLFSFLVCFVQLGYSFNSFFSCMKKCKIGLSTLSCLNRTALNAPVCILDEFSQNEQRYMQQRAQDFRNLFLQDNRRPVWGKPGTYTKWAALNAIKMNVEQRVVDNFDVAFLNKSLPFNYQRSFDDGRLDDNVLVMAVDIVGNKKMVKEDSSNKEYLKVIDELGLRSESIGLVRQAIDNKNEALEYINKYLDAFDQEFQDR